MMNIREYILERIILTRDSKGQEVYKSSSKKKRVMVNPETGEPEEYWKKGKALRTSITFDPKTGERKITIKQLKYKSPTSRKTAGYRQRLTKRVRQAMGFYTTSGRPKTKNPLDRGDYLTREGKKTYLVKKKPEDTTVAPYSMGTYNAYRKELEDKLEKMRQRTRDINNLRAKLEKHNKG